MKQYFPLSSRRQLEVDGEVEEVDDNLFLEQRRSIIEHRYLKAVVNNVK